MPAWPLSTAVVDQSGYTEGILADPTIRSNMDSGEPKARPRFSAVVKKMSGQIAALSSANCDTIFSFYDNDCAFGSLPFTWIHPRTGVAGTFKWASRPEITTTNGATFVMSISILVLP